MNVDTNARKRTRDSHQASYLISSTATQIKKENFTPLNLELSANINYRCFCRQFPLQLSILNERLSVLL